MDLVNLSHSSYMYWNTCGDMITLMILCRYIVDMIRDDSETMRNTFHIMDYLHCLDRELGDEHWQSACVNALNDV